MGFFKSLAYIAGGAALAPFTGGTSLVVGIAAGAAAGVAAKKATEYVSDRIEDGKNHARAEGLRAGERAAQSKYEKKLSDLTGRLRNYHDLDKTIIGLYAVGLAVANADGHICAEERAEIDGFVAGCAAGSLPKHVKDTINKLTQSPPSLKKATQFAIDANLARRDIQDVIDVVAMADGIVCEHEKAFIANWKKLAAELAIA